MTWAKAAPALVVAGIFDALRYFFLSFWFFGPALASIFCTIGINSFLGTTLASVVGKTVALGCGTAAGAAVYFGAPIIASFGTTMAISVGFMGWLIAVVIILGTDTRTFGENPFAVLWILEGIGASVFIMSWNVYKTQIKKERAALKKYKEEQAELQIQEQNQRMAEFVQASSNQLAQAEI